MPDDRTPMMYTDGSGKQPDGFDVATPKIRPIPAKNVESFTIDDAPDDVLAALLTMSYGKPARS